MEKMKKIYYYFICSYNPFINMDYIKNIEYAEYIEHIYNYIVNIETDKAYIFDIILLYIAEYNKYGAYKYFENGSYIVYILNNNILSNNHTINLKIIVFTPLKI